MHLFGFVLTKKVHLTTFTVKPSPLMFTLTMTSPADSGVRHQARGRPAHRTELEDERRGSG
eukprot:747802-Hanusia_phi.AAC.6